MNKALVFNKAWNSRLAGEIERIVDENDIPSIFLLSDKICDLADVPAGLDINYLIATLMATVPEKWTRPTFTDELVEPTFGVDTWTNDSAADVIVEPVFLEDNWSNDGGVTFVQVDPNDNAYIFYPTGSTLLGWLFQSSGSIDSRYTYVPTVLEYYVISEDTAAKTLADKTAQITTEYTDMNTDVLTQMAFVFGTTNPDSAAAYKETWSLMVATPSDWSVAGLTARFAVGGLTVGDALDTDQKVTDYATAKVAEVNAYGVARMQRIETFKTNKAAIEAA